MFCKEDFRTDQKAFGHFWNHEIVDRPIVCVTSPKRGMSIPESNASYYNMLNCCLNGDYDSLLANYERRIDSIFFGGEALPYYEFAIGPDQFAAFMGGELETRPEMHTSWIKSFVKDFAEYTPRLDLSKGGYLEKVKKFYEYASFRAEGRYFIQMLDLHSNMDALSAARNPQELCFDLLDCPEQIERAMREVRNLYAPVYEAVFKAGRMDKYGSIGWAPTYCDGKFAVVQCDFACMISNELFRKFVLEAVREEAAYLDRCVYHYDGKEALRHLDDILAIEEIDCIQWVPGDGQPRTVEWMDILKKIQKAGKSVWIYDWTPDEIMCRFKELEPNKVLFSTHVSTQDEAERLLEYLRRNT